MKNNVVSIERSETTREAPTVFLVEKCSRFEYLDDDGLGVSVRSYGLLLSRR
jgi:hypothetical protein